MVVEGDAIESADLSRLAHGEALALRVRHFIPADLAATLAERLLSDGFDHYVNAPSIGRIGMAFYETGNQPALLQSYFDTALQNVSMLRERCSPFLSPIDLLRCSLDEVWPAGASLEQLHGRKMFIGLSRVVEPDVCFLAHHDIFEKDAPECFHARSLQAQFACNVYLQVPKQGGMLQMWEKDLSPSQFDRLRGSSYGIEPRVLGAPDVEIVPEAGELVIFNSRKMHAVTPSRDVSRLSLSCFVGYRGEHAPLTYWS